MASRLKQHLKKATFTTSDLSGGGNGGYLSAQQARTFLRDAIEATVILAQADVFDSASPVFEVPKISFSNRIMYAGVEGARVDSGDRQEADTSLVTLTTKLFKGEVPVSDEVFEDNVEQEGLADSLAEMIAEAVGRDLEEIAIKADTGDSDVSFNQFDGIIQSLVDANVNVVSMTSHTSYKEMLKDMVADLPSRWRRTWDRLKFFVPISMADGYSDETSNRGTGLGDSQQTDAPSNRYRGIGIEEVALFSGTQNSYDYSKVALLCDPMSLKVGFHRRVRMEKFRDPREGLTSFLPTVRYDVEWARNEAVVLATGIPAL